VSKLTLDNENAKAEQPTEEFRLAHDLFMQVLALLPHDVVVSLVTL
jgi:hypothetical protein